LQNEKYQEKLLVTNPAYLRLVYTHHQTGKIILSSDCAMWMMCMNLYQSAGFVIYNCVWSYKFYSFMCCIVVLNLHNVCF